MTKLEKAAVDLLESMEVALSPQVNYSQIKNLRKALEKPATIIRSPYGMGRREVELSKVIIPDLWHIAHTLEEPHRSMILETWHLAHDLLLNLRGDIE